MSNASAPGKIILVGEHAVVYHRPALAIPLRKVRASASITEHDDPSHQDILIEALDVYPPFWLGQANPQDPLGLIVKLAFEALGKSTESRIKVSVNSSIPIAAGLGSGAAVSIAIGRAVGEYFQRPFGNQELSDMAFEVEKLHHGTPSGIDNTVIAFDQPVYFIKGSPPEKVKIGGNFKLVVADSGINSSTAEAVGRVRQSWESNPPMYENYFDQIGALTQRCRQSIETGNPIELGRIMDANHTLLNTIGVGLPELDNLVLAARNAGALGVKLSGAGLGGNAIAIVEDQTAEQVEMAMRSAGAVWTIQTEVEA
jgi:mevalonate kinase